MSPLNQAVGKGLRKHRRRPCISMIVQFNGGNIGTLTTTIQGRECYRIGKCGCLRSEGEAAKRR